MCCQPFFGRFQPSFRFFLIICQPLRHSDLLHAERALKKLDVVLIYTQNVRIPYLAENAAHNAIDLLLSSYLVPWVITPRVPDATSAPSACKSSTPNLYSGNPCSQNRDFLPSTYAQGQARRIEDVFVCISFEQGLQPYHTATHLASSPGATSAAL